MTTYKGSLARFEKLSRLILAIITIAFAVFLIKLGNIILFDINNLIKAPDSTMFRNEQALKKIEGEESVVNKKLSVLNEEKYGILKSVQLARRNYDSEKKSFDNWIEARKTIGSPGEDLEVKTRAKKLDYYKNIEDAWQGKLDIVENSERKIQLEKDKIIHEKEKILSEDNKKYLTAYNKFQLKVFALRLAFVLPLMGLGIFLFVKFRKSKLKSIIWGYIIFSLYAFFVGLVPYLPSFGGYIRFALGAALTAFAGYYLTKQLAKLIEKKKAELQESTVERSKKIKNETAIKAYQSHCCPSCEKDFLMNKWQPKTKVLKDVILEEEAPSFCQHCGLVLFDKCKNCGHRNFAHFSYCSSCGASK